MIKVKIVKGIFSGILLFYITYIPVWFLSNTPVNKIEKIMVLEYVEDFLDKLPSDDSIKHHITQSASEYYVNNEEFYDILDNRNDTSNLSISEFKKKGDFTFVEVSFILDSDVLIEILFLVKHKSIIPPRFTSEPIIKQAKVEIAGDTTKLGEMQAAILFRKIIRSDKSALPKYIYSL